MELTRRDLLLLIHGLTLAVETANVQTDGKFGSGSDLSKYPEAEEFVKAVFAENPRLSFQEMDELFSKLVKGAQTIGMSKPDRDLATLEPSSEYLH